MVFPLTKYPLHPILGHQKGYSISLRVPIHTIVAAGAVSVGVAGPHCGIDATDMIAVLNLGASGIERSLGRTLSG